MKAILLRYLVYSLLMLGVVGLLWIDSKEPVDFINAHKLGEHTWTEFFHILLSALVAIVFYLCGKADPSVKPFTTILALLFVAAMVREWEDYIHSWHETLATLSDILVVIILAGALWHLFRNREAFVYGATRLFSSVAAGYFLSGTVILFVFSRVYGTKGIWKSLMEDGYMRTVKNASEETIETLGFVLILMAAAEFCLHLKSRKQENG